MLKTVADVAREIWRLLVAALCVGLGLLPIIFFGEFTPRNIALSAVGIFMAVQLGIEGKNILRQEIATRLANGTEYVGLALLAFELFFRALLMRGFELDF